MEIMLKRGLIFDENQKITIFVYKRYLHADERGSITAVSNASGQVTQINSHDDYGIPQGKTPAGALLSPPVASPQTTSAGSATQAKYGFPKWA